MCNVYLHGRTYEYGSIDKKNKSMCDSIVCMSSIGREGLISGSRDGSHASSILELVLYAGGPNKPTERLNRICHIILPLVYCFNCLFYKFAI